MLLAIALSTITFGSDLRSTLASRYQTWDAAYLRHDVAALERMLAPRFRIVTGTGKIVSRKDYLAGLKKSKAPVAYKTKLIQVTAKGSLAYAWTEERSKHGDGPANKHRYQDEWVRTGGTWLLLESKTLDKH